MKFCEVDSGTGNRKGIIVTPEGWKGSGWAGFVRKMREMVGFQPSGSVHENRTATNSGGASWDDYRKIEVIVSTSNKGASSSREISYLLASTKPVTGPIVSLQNGGNRDYRKDGLVREGRNSMDCLTCPRVILKMPVPMVGLLR